ncbi:hypothetical protein BC835DRAFT_1267610 [Cytidiella melzeri]|nr:hypothetical protein BC835DRAFT_1267610 [Cytidiella melzeri]
MHGGGFCKNLMCVGGLVNGSTIQYTLQSLGRSKLGWISIGFGKQMANAPMVIMWPNSDGSITLSQRLAPGEVMPTLASNLSRVATLQPALSLTNGTNPKYTFTIPSDGSTQPQIIWAIGETNPESSATDATLLIHNGYGSTTIDLAGTLAAGSIDPTNPAFTLGQSSSGNGTSNPTSGTGGDNSGSAGMPLQTYEKYIIAHAIIGVLGFLLFLPLGALVARWMRTYGAVWFTLHWVSQFVIAMPLIVVSFALGTAAVNMNDSIHLNDPHKKWGVALFVLYWFQLLLGAVIHFFKPRSNTLNMRGRPVQNYFHAILGLLIIGIAFYQVRSGFRTEWPTYTGRGSVGNAANIVWIVWLVLIPTAYFAGVLLLPRQYRQEASARLGARKL